VPGQIHRRSRTSIDYDIIHRNTAVQLESHLLSHNTLDTDHDNLSDSILSNLSEITNNNSDSSNAVNESSISIADQTNEQTVNTNDEQESNPLVGNDLIPTVHNNIRTLLSLSYKKFYENFKKNPIFFPD
jgi:hypothetical protein